MDTGQQPISLRKKLKKQQQQQQKSSYPHTRGVCYHTLYMTIENMNDQNNFRCPFMFSMSSLEIILEIILKEENAKKALIALVFQRLDTTLGNMFLKF